MDACWRLPTIEDLRILESQGDLEHRRHVEDETSFSFREWYWSSEEHKTLFSAKHFSKNVAIYTIKRDFNRVRCVRSENGELIAATHDEPGPHGNYRMTWEEARQTAHNKNLKA